ncbi:penicillin-binding protein 1C [Castellaniella sp. GW247-6E4]|uniref:penicillin-binding protein 1C n=1 Tax=Castellaniella sp. GW247-6E4 TaxID=3140380 RepID=UPI0033151B9A
MPGARALAGLALCLLAAQAQALPTYEAVRAAHRPSDVRVLAADGEVVQRVRTDFSSRRGDWVVLENISVALRRAVLRSEDSRFYRHAGVDWLAMARAGWRTLSSGRAQGASTLSMQLAALLDDDLRRGPDGRGLMQKIDQIQAARELEAGWTKTQILEAYLNLAAFRGELVGVDALARVMFQKRASALDDRESALAAALLRGPNASPAVLARRGCVLLSEQGRTGDCAGLRDFAEFTLGRTAARRRDAPGLAPHFARLLVARRDALADDGVLRTALDQGLQRTALASIRRHLHDLRGTGVTDAALVVLDNRSGAILAYVGSSGGFSDAGAVDHARALRQAGSTLKPFLYGMALDEGRLTAASLLDDRPLDLDGGGGLYIPGNYDGRFSGWVSARLALASSLNIPAVRAAMMVTPDALARRLADLGLPLTHDGDYYGYSLALGSADVSLLTLVNAYRALAQLGRYAPIDLDAGARGGEARIPAQPGVALYSPGAAWIVGDILSDRQARARTFGLDSPLSTPFWTAVKTGTSRDMRDNWCIGWSRDYTVGVWVGNSAGASMREVSGVSGAGPIWHDMMAWLHRGRGSVQPPMPTGVVRVPVRFAQGPEPAREEVFLGDTAQPIFAAEVPWGEPAGRLRLAEGQPSGHEVMPEARALRIAEPVDGTIMALDPDIPFDRQRLRLRAVDAGARPVVARWFLDGVALDGEEWRPVPGRHRFELRGPDGGILDRARVVVRGGDFMGDAPVRRVRTDGAQ